MSDDPIAEFREEDGAIHHMPPPYAYWCPGQKTISLDGDFTVEQLEALAAHMRQHNV